MFTNDKINNTTHDKNTSYIKITYGNHNRYIYIDTLTIFSKHKIAQDN